MKLKYTIFFILCFFILFSCGPKDTSEETGSTAERKEVTYYGICRPYTGPKTHITHYIELENGQKVEIQTSKGDDFVGKYVHLTVLYEHDGIHFDILSMVAEKTNAPAASSPPQQPLDEENRLIAGIRTNMNDADSILRSITTDLKDTKSYIEEKKKDLPFMQQSYREDEKKRISSLAREARGNIETAMGTLDSFNHQLRRIDSVRWVSDRKESFTREVETKIRTLESTYLDTIESFRDYFDDLNY